MQAKEKIVTFDEAAEGPLQGVRVLDLSRLVAGNMLSLQLGDFGADVIKIEPPAGDPLRAWKDAGKQLHWKTYGRNKRSVLMNLRQDTAKKALMRLISGADVLIENYRPGTLEKMGLAPEVLHKCNPDLIIVRISGFGQTGPYSHLPGFGTLVEAMSGFADRNGFADREPVLPPLALADMIAGLYGASATAMALLAKNRGMAKGQVIDLSLLEPIFSVLGPEASAYKLTGKTKQRAGSSSNTSSPRNTYRCLDGKYVALSGSTQVMATRVFTVIGKPELIKDSRFSDNSARVNNRDLVDAELGGWFAKRTREESLKTMRQAGVTVGPVYGIEDIVKDDHFREREIIVNVEDRDLGSLQMHNIVPRLSTTPGVWRRPAPNLGEHTEEVLSRAGVDADSIAEILEGARVE